MVTRAEAKALGLGRYFSGSRCKHGHVSERATRNGDCLECATVRLATRDRTEELRRKRTPEARVSAREYARVWRDEHREEVRTYHRDYSRVLRSDPAVRKQESANTVKRRKANPAIAQRHRDAALAWAKKNPDKRADSRMRRRARMRAAFVEAVPRVEVFERDGWQCQICKARLKATARAPHPKAPTVDHIVPLSKGGKHERKNLQCACYECNVRKGNRAADDQLLLVG